MTIIILEKETLGIKSQGIFAPVEYFIITTAIITIFDK